MPELTIPEALDLALQHYRAGRLAQAEQMYRQILAAQPDHAEAHCKLGMVLKGQGAWAQALAAFRRAVALTPDFAEAHYNLGIALLATGEFNQAVASWRQVIAFKPDLAEAHCNLGLALKETGELDEAVAAFRRAIVLKPDLAEAHCNLGSALVIQAAPDEAAAACRRAIALQPNSAVAYGNLGSVLVSQGELDQAVAAFRQAVALSPHDAEAYANLGSACKEQGQIDQALECYRKALALNGRAAGVHSNLCLALYYHPRCNARSILTEMRRWAQCHARPLAGEIRPAGNQASADRRLKVAYVSADFRDHPVGRFCVPLLANHDHPRFEIFCYSDAGREDAITRRLHSAGCDCWQNVRGLGDGPLAEKIRADGIDILVDLAAHTAGNRLLVFARKPAPVQVSYLAYCGTTGLDTIDYRLSDPYLDPPREDDSIYSERTIRLPETYWCYKPGILTPEVNGLPALAHGSITFGCLNNFCKVSDSTLAAWAKLLRAMPGSQLLLHAHQGSHRQRLHERLKQEGIEAARVQFVGQRPMEKYLQLYHQIDIALDTFPYAGGTTTCDALWMGVPVVSLVGQTAVGRGGWSILSNLGLAELAGRSAQEYVRLANDLARDLGRLSHLRSTLRQRMQRSPLLDAPRFARNLEAAYRWMWRSWCQQNPPAT